MGGLAMPNLYLCTDARSSGDDLGDGDARSAHHQPAVATAADDSFAWPNVAELTTDAQLVLKNLGQALSDSALKDYRFRIAGHTDSVGGTDFNQRLSEARAKSVRDYLIAEYRIASDRILFEGFGKSRLFDPANPTAEINRRVEITNIGQ